MDDEIRGDAQQALERVQKIFDELVPGAVCELQDYEHRIGCGALDQWDELQDVRFLRRGLTEELVRHQALVLKTKLRTGGSTAGA